MIVFWFCFWAFIAGFLMEAGRDLYKLIKNTFKRGGDQ